MKDTIIKNLYSNTENYYGKEIRVSGWVRTVRNSKTFGFIELNDGSFFKNIQIVFDNSLENFDEICKLTLSSSITVIGDLIKTENAWNIYEQLHIYVQEQTHLMLYLEFVQYFHMQSTNFFKKITLCMFILQ